MGKQDYKGAEKHVFTMLEQGLDKNLYYHNLDHTKDIIRVVDILAELEEISEEEHLDLKPAALCHDTGQLFGPQEHEKRSVRIAKSILPIYGYNAKNIDRISNIIMATKMPQKPRTLLQKIICDADLDNFGRGDFFDMGALLRKELEEQGIKMSDKEWYEGTLKLLKKHHYFTESARKLRQEKKEDNLAKVKELLGK